MMNLFMTMGTSEVSTPINILVIGDSTMASFGCRPNTIASKLLTNAELNEGYNAYSIAVGGATINNQLSAWNSYANKSNIDLIIIQIGLNDMNTISSTNYTNYQNLINTINSTKKSGAKVLASCMLPCKSRWSFLGWVDGQQHWLDLNNFIMNDVTGVDYSNSYHVSRLSDSDGNLAPQYDCGDGIHENQDGANIIIQGFRNIIFQ